MLSLGRGRSRGSELKVGADVAHLDLNALALVAGVVLPRAMNDLAGHEDHMPFLSVRLAFSATERHAVQRKNGSRGG